MIGAEFDNFARGHGRRTQHTESSAFVQARTLGVPKDGLSLAHASGERSHESKCVSPHGRVADGPNELKLTGGPLRRAQPPHAGRPR